MQKKKLLKKLTTKKIPKNISITDQHPKKANNNK